MSNLSVAQAIKNLRGHLELTQLQFAELMNVDAATIGAYESRRTPGKGFLRRLSMLAIEEGKHEENQVFIAELEQRVEQRKLLKTSA